MRPPGDGLTDGAETDNAESRTVDVATEKERRVPWSPGARANNPVAFADSACDTEDQGKGEVRRRLSQHTGRVRDQYAPLSRRVYIDVVVANRHVAHYADARR